MKVSHGYWAIEKNRKDRLLDFINDNLLVDNLHTKDKSLYEAAIKYDGSVRKLAEKTGLKWTEISSRIEKNFYRDFNNVKVKIEQFIEQNDRFPTKNEIIKNLGIQQRSITFHGGMDELKRKMNYNDENDLIDSSGFNNRSLLEFMVAEFLIANNVSYLREQMPFPKSEGYYRSDFTISTSKGVFHIEVWGYQDSFDSGSEIVTSYSMKRRIKTKLYKKYNLNLIEIEQNELTRKPLDSIQDTLVNKFKIILDHDIKKVNDELLISPLTRSDEEIMQVFMKYSEDNKILPTANVLLNNKLSGYLNEVRKRHSTYLNFANKVGKELTVRKHEWNNDDKVYQEFFNLIKKGISLERRNFRKFNLGGLVTYIKNSSKAIHTFKLDFYDMYLNQISVIPDKELDYLKNVSINRGSNIMNKVTPEQQEQAKLILENYKAKHLHPTT